MDNIKNFDDLKKKYKDDPDYKDHPKMNCIGVDAEKLVISHADLIKKPVVPIEYIIDPILPKNGYVLFHAEAGIGKTYFCLNLAYIVAQGGRFLKFAAPIPQKVLYVDAEMGEEALRRRIEFIHQKQEKLYFDNLHYLFFDKFPNGVIPPIDTQEGRDFYTKHLIDGEYKVVFWDNLLNLSSVDHNKVNEWKPIQDWIRALRKIGIAFFLIHHAGSEVTKQLGTETRKAIANTVISLQKSDDEENPGKLKIVYQKTRDMKGNEIKPFEVINNFDGTWSLHEIELSTYDQVVAWFKLNANGSSIAKTLDIKPQTVSKHKKRAIERGDLIVGKRGIIENVD